MLTQLLLALEYRRGLRCVAVPVDLTVFQIMQINLAYWWLLVTKRIFGVLAPMIGRTDDDAMRKGFLA
jgi:hypothetical protein